jgi:L-asparaginase
LKKNQTEDIPMEIKGWEKRSMHIKIFATGGTIDKVYFDATSEYQVGPPNISAVFDELKLEFTYTIESLMKKDSLELTDEDRAVICRAVAEDPAERILITHGTDTMVETAKTLAGIQGKTIVLTGALKPALFKTTDAVFNIGCAVAAVQTMGPGVYVVMNGRIFSHDTVRKNVKLGKFETIE